MRWAELEHPDSRLMGWAGRERISPGKSVSVKEVGGDKGSELDSLIGGV